MEPLGPPHVFMEWPQGLCMEPLGPPSCIHGMATRLMYGATRTPLMYSWNGHKAYVWSHSDPPHVFMEWPQGFCMEPLGPHSCIRRIATRLMYRATGTPPHVFMEWPQGLCMEPLGPPSCIHGMATRLMHGATRTPLMYSWNGHKAYVWSHWDPPHVFMEWPQGLCMEPLGPPSCIHGMATRLMHGDTRTPLMYSWNGHKAYVWSH